MSDTVKPLSETEEQAIREREAKATPGREALTSFPCNCYANENGWKCKRCAALGDTK